MTPYTILLGFLWALCAAGIAVYTVHITQQITYVTLADGRKQERSLPLLFRLLLPLTPNLHPLFARPIFAPVRQRTARNITASGFEGLITAEELLALRLLMPLVLGVPWILFVGLSKSTVEGGILDKLDTWLYLLGFLWLYAYPGLWLRKALLQRHRLIRRAIPFTLDLLTLSVEAGLDFMTALQRNVDRGKIDALCEELIRVIREIQLGKTRREALKDLATRVNLQELTSVINALLQADELGVSIGAILRIQAEQMRQRRFERAEKLANEAPVKMLFPLLAFIFPAVFLILLGPIITRLIQQGF